MLTTKIDDAQHKYWCTRARVRCCCWLPMMMMMVAMMHRGRIPPPSTCNQLLLEWAHACRDATRVIKLSRFGPVDRAHVRSAHALPSIAGSAPKRLWHTYTCACAFFVLCRFCGLACLLSLRWQFWFMYSVASTHARAWCLFITVT